MYRILFIALLVGLGIVLYYAVPNKERVEENLEIVKPKPTVEESAARMRAVQKFSLSPIEDFDARLEYVNLLIILKKFDEAHSELNALLEEGKGDDKVFLEMAKVYLAQKEYDKAVLFLNKVPPGVLDSEKKRVEIELLIDKQEFAEAEKILEEEIKSGHVTDETTFQLASVLAWDMKYTKSLALFEELLEKHPKDTQLRRHYAQVLFWAKKYEKSAEEWKKTLP